VSNPDEDPIAQHFADELRKRLGARIKEIRLFGSRARGDAHEDSDYDMFVIVDRKTPDLRSVVLDVEVELLDAYGVLVTSIIQTRESWNDKQNFPLARNIANEGVPL